MHSNLPLLFANGFPTSIDMITQDQLQTFIPFLVQCSLGRDTTKVVTIPKWWPNGVPLINPTTKPSCDNAKWLLILKDIVRKCYRFHNCEYLISFCNDLTKHDHSNLRYVNNFNGTTSLYIKGNGRLLCTFRNENIVYDRKEIASRKYLKPRVVNTIKILDDEDDDEMVTTEAIDIYFCESCGAELESLSDMQEHEEICGVQKESEPIQEPDHVQTNFLNYFKLTSIKSKEVLHITPSSPVKQIINSTRRTRGHCDLKKSRNIPFSSPAGKLLLKNANLDINEDLRKEKLNKIEKLCAAPNINLEAPKFLSPSIKNKSYKVTFKKKITDYERFYQFPVGHILTSSGGKNSKQSCVRHENNIPDKKCDIINQIDESVIDLCSSDEETNAGAPNMNINDEANNSILHNSISDSMSLLPVVNRPSSPICRIAQTLYTENGILRPSQHFVEDNGECIDLCSSDEETILPDLPNYTHLSLIRIPVGPRIS